MPSWLNISIARPALLAEEDEPLYLNDLYIGGDAPLDTVITATLVVKRGKLGTGGVFAFRDMTISGVGENRLRISGSLADFIAFRGAVVISYKGDKDFFGLDELKVTASANDGAEAVLARTIEVGPQNDRPTLTAPDYLVAKKNTDLNVKGLSVSDVDNEVHVTWLSPDLAYTSFSYSPERFVVGLYATTGSLVFYDVDDGAVVSDQPHVQSVSLTGDSGKIRGAVSSLAIANRQPFEVLFSGDVPFTSQKVDKGADVISGLNINGEYVFRARGNTHQLGRTLPTLGIESQGFSSATIRGYTDYGSFDFPEQSNVQVSWPTGGSRYAFEATGPVSSLKSLLSGLKIVDTQSTTYVDISVIGGEGNLFIRRGGTAPAYGAQSHLLAGTVSQINSTLRTLYCDDNVSGLSITTSRLGIVGIKPTEGLTITGPQPLQVAQVKGAIYQINNTLKELVYRPQHGYTGDDKISVTLVDAGIFGGQGGTVFEIDADIDLYVEDVNVPPVVVSRRSIVSAGGSPVLFPVSVVLEGASPGSPDEEFVEVTISAIHGKVTVSDGNGVVVAVLEE